jgi:hypothetical protein
MVSRSHLSKLKTGAARRERAAASPRNGAKASTTLVVASKSASKSHPQASSLLVIRVLFLLFYGCLGSVMPYLPIYYKSLGLAGVLAISHAKLPYGGVGRG